MKIGFFTACNRALIVFIIPFLIVNELSVQELPKPRGGFGEES